jgi:hypothetical protein
MTGLIKEYCTSYSQKLFFIAIISVIKAVMVRGDLIEIVCWESMEPYLNLIRITAVLEIKPMK